jgi:hypothetical protein
VFPIAPSTLVIAVVCWGLQTCSFSIVFISIKDEASLLDTKGTIFWSWDLGFEPVSCSLCSGISGFGPEIFGLCSGISGGSSCMGSGLVVWGGLSVSRGGDWGCGGDGGCSIMMVDGVVSGSRSSWISMMWVVRDTERVRGTVDEMGWVLRTVLGKILVLSMLSIFSVMNIALSISMTSVLVNTACSDSCGNTDNVLFLCSNGYVSSSYSESLCVRDYFLCTSGLDIVPTPAS